MENPAEEYIPQESSEDIPLTESIKNFLVREASISFRNSVVVLYSSEMKVEDAISDLSSLRVVKMKGACNRSNTVAFQHQKPGGCYKVVEMVNRTRYLEKNRWAIVKGSPQSEQPK